MSFTFKWPRFSDQFHADAIQMLDAALNKGNKPPVIADKIEVVELEMGTQPPELEIRDIGELTVDQFRGIFRLTYAGDAHIVLRTKVQANPLNHKQPDIHLMGGSRGMLAAKQPLVVPMLLRLSHFKLNSYVVLVVSKQKGITLVFKTDPLQNVDINSTFDSIAVIQKFIQREIEGQLRQMFREDLPGIIHRLSQQWVKAKVEAPYLDRHPPEVRKRNFETASTPDLSSYRVSRSPSVGFPLAFVRRPSSSAGGHVRAPSSAYSASSAGRRPTNPSPAPPPTPIEPPAPSMDGPTSFPDLENFDPTYGLRPEGLPAKSLFGGFRNMFFQNKGLADLAEEPSDFDDNIDEGESFDASNWDDFLSDYNPASSISHAESVTEYESTPAVGGGTITRPRIYHSQSLIQSQTGGVSPLFHKPSLSVRSSVHPSPMLDRPSLSLPLPSSSRPGSLYTPYSTGITSRDSTLDLDSIADTDADTGWPESVAHKRHSMSSIPPVPPLDYSPPRRTGSASSVLTQPSRSSDMTHSLPTPPASEREAGIRINRARRLSSASLNLDKFSGSPPEQHYMPAHDPTIVLRPTVNGSVSKLSTLSHSNHTLSPYTRTVEHYTVRSVPPREATSGPVSSVDRPPVKARRKRTHRLGPSRPSDVPQDTTPPSAPASPVPFSEFDASEMDRYFRSHDDLIPRYPELHPPSHIRRRFPPQPS